jgi:hypothetical protein
LKFSELKSIGHNICDSLGSGCGLMIGVYDMDIYGEASATPEAHITVDFLTGETSGSPASSSLARAVRLYRDALPTLCERHGGSVSDFVVLSARFGSDSLRRPHFTVTIEDAGGRTSSDSYVGMPGRRVPRRRVTA